MIRRLLLSAVAVGILVAASASPAAALSSSIDPMWMTNGTLFVQTQVGNIMYLGGKNFTPVRSTPNGTPGPKINVSNLGAIDITTGQGVSSFHPMVTHAADLAMVRAIAATPDGSKLYIAGHFDAVDGLAVQNIARIDLSTGTIDTSFKAKVAAGGTVNALLVSADGSRIYLGGEFGNVDGVARKNLAALNADGSIVDGWDPVRRTGRSMRSRSRRTRRRCSWVASSRLWTTSRDDVARVSRQHGRTGQLGDPAGHDLVCRRGTSASP